MAPSSMFSPGWAATPAAESVSEEALADALLEVEAAWGEVLAEHGHASHEDAAALSAIRQERAQLPELAPASLAEAAAGGGNPVIPLIGRLRAELKARGAGDSALHRGATSQDILDTALALLARRSVEQTLADLDAAAEPLAQLADAHRDTLCTAHSLTQHALPTVFGLKAAVWLDGLTASAVRLQEAAGLLPLQWGGAVGTQAALAEMVGTAGARELTAALGLKLGLSVPGLPWHVQRQPVLSLASALAGVTASLGKAAGDVLTLQRPEVGELREPAAAGKGGSSAMPQKQNPVLATLIRTGALSAPGHLATLHQAAAAADDERPDGAWHAEWPSLAELLRITGGAAHRARELFEGLMVNTETMAANLSAAGDTLLSERLMLALADQLPRGKPQLQELIAAHAQGQADLRATLTEAVGDAHAVDSLLDPGGYLGRADELIDAAIAAHRQRAGDLTV